MNISTIAETCNPLELPCSPLKGKAKKLPNTSGIYFLYKDKELLYIGQSTNIQLRHACHDIYNLCKYREGIEKDQLRLHWLVLPNSKSVLNEAEWSFIIKHKPPLNKENLIKKLQKLRFNHTIHSIQTLDEWMKGMNDQSHSVEEVEAVIDRRVSTAELQSRYGLSSRTTVVNRIKELGIETYKEGRLVYVSEQSLQALDALHECMKIPGATSKECILKIKGQMHDSHIQQGGTTSEFIKQQGVLVQNSIEPSLIKALAYLMNQSSPTDPWNKYEQLDRIAAKGWLISSSQLLSLLELQSIPKLDDHNRFSRMGFTFYRIGKVGRQYEWRINKQQP